MEEKEIQTCVDTAIKTYFDKFAEKVTQESEAQQKVTGSHKGLLESFVNPNLLFCSCRQA